MFTRLIHYTFSLLRKRTSSRAPQAAKEVDSLFDERRRLAKALTSYRDFGFDDLESDGRRRILEIDRRLREIRRANMKPQLREPPL